MSERDCYELIGKVCRICWESRGDWWAISRGFGWGAKQTPQTVYIGQYIYTIIDRYIYIR